ncbi:MAG TPA: hypothetical protein VGP72_03825 [Planctomycetota bacterium]|jgi:hypothetical protein
MYNAPLLPGFDDAPPANKPQTVTRWCIAVYRQSGAVEVLSLLIDNEAEAIEHAQRCEREYFRGIKARAARCEIRV